jgi:hypothetical protein
MKTKNVTFMCVQPAIPYFAWQIEVMLENFKTLNIHKNNQIDILVAYNTNEPDFQDKLNVMNKVQERYQDVAEFFYYQDTRIYPFSYTSSIRPNILKQHFKKFPQLEEECVFYHDCDIIFTKYPDFIHDLCGDDLDWYVSDTISYLGYNYVESKGSDVLNLMCEIIGIHPELVKKKENQAGGAQYLMKKVDWVFWDKVEKDCEKLFKEVTELNIAKKILDPKYHELQIWCSDMWSIAWNAWMRGYNTNVIPELNFAWATDDISKWEENYIMHNAGVTHESSKDLFYKADYTNKLPYDIQEENYLKNRCSYKYFELIKSVGEKSCLR